MTPFRNLARRVLPAAWFMLVAGLAMPSLAQDPPEDLEVASGLAEITLPPDGILRYGSVTLHAGADVSFVRNLANTPVYLLAEGPVVIEAGAFIRLNGKSPVGPSPGAGGPGGFSGGNGTPYPSGEGEGPGGGQGGCPTYSSCNPNDNAAHGAFGCDNDTSPASGIPYGNPVLLSLIGGSGGGAFADNGGSGGGGALLLSSLVSISHAGTITALGGVPLSGSGAGSGGAIRLLAPIVSGNGSLQVTGSVSNHGRIRIDGLDRSGVAFAYAPNCAVTTGSIMTQMATTGTLRISAVGGKPIAADAQGPVFVSLDSGDPKSVTVRINGFGGIVPIEVALIPDQGVRQTLVVSADMDTADIDGNVSVTATFASFPVNQAVRVDAWTR